MCMTTYRIISNAQLVQELLRDCRSANSNRGLRLYSLSLFELSFHSPFRNQLFRGWSKWGLTLHVSGSRVLEIFAWLSWFSVVYNNPQWPGVEEDFAFPPFLSLFLFHVQQMGLLDGLIGAILVATIISAVYGRSSTFSSLISSHSPLNAIPSLFGVVRIRLISTRLF